MPSVALSEAGRLHSPSEFAARALELASEGGAVDCGFVKLVGCRFLGILDVAGGSLNRRPHVESSLMYNQE